MSSITTAAIILGLQESGIPNGEILQKLTPSLLKEPDTDYLIWSLFGREGKVINWSHWARKIDESEENDVRVISIFDPIYPWFLKMVPDPPALLHIRGNIDLVSSTIGVAIVGTREPSSNGETIAQRLGAYFSTNGWPVVSGLALGIDRAAHEGCLAGPSPTIAVLAHGLHMCSPKANEDIGAEILARNGAWVSEHVYGKTPRRNYFVPRNRIQVGLSAGSIIVEAGLKSGTMTQARYCLKQNKPLFAVVPDLEKNHKLRASEGAIELVRRGDAIPIRSRGDYLSVEALIESSKLRMTKSRERWEAAFSSEKPKNTQQKLL